MWNDLFPHRLHSVCVFVWRFPNELVPFVLQVSVSAPTTFNTPHDTPEFAQPTTKLEDALQTTRHKTRSPGGASAATPKRTSFFETFFFLFLFLFPFLSALSFLFACLFFPPLQFGQKWTGVQTEDSPFADS
jgi:hypothetical protein